MDLSSEVSLSVVVITKNEEQDLPGFLESFSKIADEIVIIDDGSTDRTEEIAKAAGPDIFFISSPRKATEGFCDQRQKGVDAARGEWLLQVDCDMRLTPELAIEVLSGIKDEKAVAYRFRLQQYFMNKRVRYGGFQYWNQHWLSRRNATSWSQKVHERIHVNPAYGSIKQLESRMIHLNDENFSERLRKNHQYSKLEAVRFIEEGERIHLCKFFVTPIWRAFRSYVLMFGFRDGKVGFLWSYYQFTGLSTIYFLAWEMQNGGSRIDNEKSIKNEMNRFRKKVAGEKSDTSYL